jgi:hypothetical protein
MHALRPFSRGGKLNIGLSPPLQTGRGDRPERAMQPDSPKSCCITPSFPRPSSCTLLTPSTTLSFGKLLLYSIAAARRLSFCHVLVIIFALWYRGHLRASHQIPPHVNAWKRETSVVVSNVLFLLRLLRVAASHRNCDFKNTLEAVPRETSSRTFHHPPLTKRNGVNHSSLPLLISTRPFSLALNSLSVCRDTTRPNNYSSSTVTLQPDANPIHSIRHPFHERRN